MEIIGPMQSRPYRVVDITGQRFGRLIALSVDHIAPSGAKWLCKCDCGNSVITYSASLRFGKTASCGCLRTENNIKLRTKHGHSPKDKETSTYTVWLSMKARCHTPTNSKYEHYGKRGITVCPEWRNFFEAFLRDMGEKPEGLSLDRIDNNKGYYKENCRWATLVEQANNKRNNHLHTFQGESLTLAGWARKLGVNTQTLRSRYYLCGWSIDKILTTPVRK